MSKRRKKKSDLNLRGCFSWGDQEGKFPTVHGETKENFHEGREKSFSRREGFLGYQIRGSCDQSLPVALQLVGKGKKKRQNILSPRGEGNLTKK